MVQIKTRSEGMELREDRTRFKLEQLPKFQVKPKRNKGFQRGQRKKMILVVYSVTIQHWRPRKNQRQTEVI